MPDFSWDDLDPTKPSTTATGTMPPPASPLGGYEAAFGASMPSSSAPTMDPYGPQTPAPPAAATPTPATPTAPTATRAATPTQSLTQSEPTDPWSADMPSASGEQPGAGGLAPSAEPAAAGDTTAKYKDLMGQITAAQDPQQKAVLKDQLARSVFVSLKTAGHDVKWDGDQLMVDGRPYVVAGGIATGEGSPNAGPAPTLDQAATQQPSWMTGNTPVNLPGWDSTRTDGDPKMEWGRYVQSKGGHVTGDDVRAFVAQDPRWEIDPNSSPDDPHIRVKQSELDKWKPGTSIYQDVIGDSGPGGRNIGQFSNVEGDPALGYAAPSGPGEPVETLYDDILNPGTPGAAGVPTGGAVPPPAAVADWTPTAPAYTPGTVDNSDLAGFGMDDILGKLGPGTTPATLPTDYQAGTVSNDPLDTYTYEGQRDLGTLGAGRTQGETEDLVSRILAHPESMDARTVEMLKAKSKDELAEMQNQEDEDLTAAGYRTGNQDSNWLQSEKLASAGRRDQAVVASNRAVDMKAAETNQADRRSAAALGQGFSESKALIARADAAEKLAQQQADEGNKQAAAESRRQAAEFRRQGEQINEQLRGEGADRNLKAAQQNIDNQFRSTAERQTAVKLAADTALAASAQKGDRMAFEEQIRQKAAELGQNADKLRQDYVLGLLHEATSRYGVDVGASVDRAKLSQAGVEFQQDLAFRLLALKQANAQFGAQYGLDLTKTQHAIDQDMYSRYADTFGE